MNTLAFDLGASNGKAVVGSFNGETLKIKEVHRFPNQPVQVGDRLYWDILRLYHEVQLGLMKACDHRCQSMGIDSWGVDFGLVGPDGELLANPYHYRDRNNEGMIEEVSKLISKKEIFKRTGIQFIPINTIYRLYAMKKAQSPLLDRKATLLMIPDLLNYFLTGHQVSEFTNATTTQLFNTKTNQWDSYILNELGIPTDLFLDVVEPGTTLGSLLPSVVEDLQINKLSVVIVGEHDTASAVAAVPTTGPDFAYLSCGTWSLMGTEVKEPLINEQSLAWNFTNEGGVYGTFRLLKNIMGLWILQECKREWNKKEDISYEQMLLEAEQAKPFRSFIDPNDTMFLNPKHMLHQIQEYCKLTHQPVPESRGEMVRCILESLALTYQLELSRLSELTQKQFDGLHLVGGGIHNRLLSQFTANALGLPVWAGPAEASAIGNLLVQYITVGEIKNLKEGREMVKHSFAIHEYEPQQTSAWQEAYGRFLNLLNQQV